MNRGVLIVRDDIVETGLRLSASFGIYETIIVDSFSNLPEVPYDDQKPRNRFERRKAAALARAHG